MSKSTGQDKIYALSGGPVFTDALPKLCWKPKCLNSVVKGKTYCKDHVPVNDKPLGNYSYYNDKISKLRAQPRSIGTVYFVKIISHPYMKIGRTQSFKKRMRELENASPFKIRIYSAIKAPFWLEEKLHDYFKKDRIRGEWFRTSGEMYRIANMLQEGFKTEIYDLLEESGL